MFTKKNNNKNKKEEVDFDYTLESHHNTRLGSLNKYLQNGFDETQAAIKKNLN